MGIIDNFLSLNIQQLFLRGNIAKAYEKMYEIAESIASHEVTRRMEIINNKSDSIVKNKGIDYFWSYFEKIVKYKEKRIEYHMNEMKTLLKLREELKESKK
ncbi:MAG: hypothetical protein AABW63_01515 [Nanoarchaeota archaeon]